MIRQICSELTPVGEPEKALIEFKKALDEAANAERIPYGVERTEMLSHIVSLFIAELYGSAERGKPPHSSSRTGVASLPQITSKDGSHAPRL